MLVRESGLVIVLYVFCVMMVVVKRLFVKLFVELWM